jgi:hypothetical protein
MKRDAFPGLTVDRFSRGLRCPSCGSSYAIGPVIGAEIGPKDRAWGCAGTLVKIPVVEAVKSRWPSWICRR